MSKSGTVTLALHQEGFMSYILVPIPDSILGEKLTRWLVGELSCLPEKGKPLPELNWQGCPYVRAGDVFFK